MIKLERGNVVKIVATKEQAAVFETLGFKPCAVDADAEAKTKAKAKSETKGAPRGKGRAAVAEDIVSNDIVGLMGDRNTAPKMGEGLLRGRNGDAGD